jgi:hypothetical protein
MTDMKGRRLARLEADRQANMKAWQEEMGARRDKKLTPAEIEPEREVKMMACQEMEACLEKKELISLDRKPEAAERGVPVVVATIMLVGEQRKRCRDRKLATEQRCEVKELTQNRGGYQKGLAVAHRETNQRMKVARKTQADQKVSCCLTVA